MRATDINTHFSFLAEGLMAVAKDWIQEKYYEPFIENIAESQPYSFSVNGQNFSGIIQNGPEVAKEIKYALEYYRKKKDLDLLKSIRFDVAVTDDDGEETDEFVDDVRLSQIFKDEKIKGELKINLGNIAEMALGCAVTAKFEHQGAQIDETHLKDVGRRLADGRGMLNTNSGKDAIEFVASVPFADRKGFYSYLEKDSRNKTLQDYNVKADTIKAIGQHIASAVAYVNQSPRVAAAVNKASDDPGANEVKILSEGGNAENQKVTKVDLKIVVDGREFNLLSVKAGDVKQVGQTSGYLFDNLNRFFQDSVGLQLPSSVQNTFLDIDTSLTKGDLKAEKANVREANYNNGFVLAYDYMAKLLSNVGKKDPVDLVERLYNGLLFHTTRNEENVEMVILNPSAKKAFSELTFGRELREALNDYKLVVYRKHGNSMHELDVYGFPITDKAKKAQGSSKELLVRFRSFAQKNAVRNVVEMGGLLKELADWEKIEQRKAEKPAAPVTTEPKIAPPVAKKQVQQPAAPVQEPQPETQDDLAALKKNAGLPK